MEELNKNVYNSDFIESIKCFEIRECDYIKFYERKNLIDKIFNFKTGFYDTFIRLTYIGAAKDLENGIYHDVKYIVIDNVVYHRPKIVIKFVSGQTLELEFDTNEECYEKMIKLKEKFIKNTLEF